MELRPTESSPSLAQHRDLFVAQPLTNDSGCPRIRKILVANRGEIACRVIDTCHKLGIHSTAVYVTEDQRSRHVDIANEAICLGSINNTETGNPFLNIELLVSVAVDVGAQAVHPGYGYLSENPDFAQAVRGAGLIFIGPSADAMSTLGDKRSSKIYLDKNLPRVPLIPGYTGSSDSIVDLELAAKDLGYPVMIKASAGGGGKGMRIVRNGSMLREELGRAQSEAQRSFGSADCILEKYIEAAKHVEIQLLGDQHGNVISLWERDCSVQRRHQKVIEETPCTWLTDELRQAINESAVEIGRLLKYEGAGTVEFVVDVVERKYYFLEVNTRLQVEHPITEEVVGLDIVALQIFVASQGNLAELPAMGRVTQNGHAIECRVCAEDPETEFSPQNGLVRHWEPPRETKGVRYETAVQTGSNISIYFDPLIAKVVVWAPTRSQAIERMRNVLADTICLGPKTNLRFLQNCLMDESFHDPSYTTSLISTRLKLLLHPPRTDSEQKALLLLPLIPVTFIRWRQSRDTGSFRSIRHAFRNQHYAMMASDSVIVTSSDTIQSDGPVIVTSSMGSSDGNHSFHAISLRKILETIRPETTSSKDTVKQYSMVSAALKNGNDIYGKLSSQSIKIEHCDCTFGTQRASDQSTSRWLTAKMRVNIDGHRFCATIVMDVNHGQRPYFTQKAQGDSLFLHVPNIGSQLEYECFSLLSYFEAMRIEALSSDGLGGRKIMAPMPCKILSILKPHGEQIKAGDSIMVVESMKMEMNITATADGVLHLTVKEGDAIEENSVLCEVEQVT